ncbi:hypothetical protein MD484_g3857, partial [Candolleomyces efflorescens]
MSTSTTGKIWCLLVGPTRAVVGSEFYVDVRDTDPVADLAALVKKARPHALDNYDPGDCVVLRAIDPCLTTRDAPKISRKVTELYRRGKLQRVPASDEIGQLDPILGKDELLIIEFGCPEPPREDYDISDEVVTMHLASRGPSPSPHIIALKEHLVVDTETYLIFSQLNRIYEWTVIQRKIKQPCQSLIKGVAYLHANGVAHLDLQMDNLVYDEAGTLKIIDFDSAVRVRDEEQEVVGYRGASEWTAPEVGEENGPEQRYSAIKADRWAVGRLLEVFLKYEPSSDLSAFADELMADDPNERPSLVQWCERQNAEK